MSRPVSRGGSSGGRTAVSGQETGQAPEPPSRTCAGSALRSTPQRRRLRQPACRQPGKNEASSPHRCLHVPAGRPASGSPPAGSALRYAPNQRPPRPHRPQTRPCLPPLLGGQQSPAAPGLTVASLHPRNPGFAAPAEGSHSHGTTQCPPSQLPPPRPHRRTQLPGRGYACAQGSTGAIPECFALSSHEAPRGLARHGSREDTWEARRVSPRVPTSVGGSWPPPVPRGAPAPAQAALWEPLRRPTGPRARIVRP